MLAFAKKLFLALFLFVLLLFVYQNLEGLSAKVPFVFDLYVEGYQYRTPDFPVWILFALFFLLGMLTAGFHGVYERLARRLEIRKRDKRIRGLEKELGELRAQAAELRSPAPAEGEVLPEAERKKALAGSDPQASAPEASPAGPGVLPGREEEPTL